MADSNVTVTAGTGTNIDTRTEATNGHHRQVVVLGDPATNAGVAPVDATAGLKVDLGADNDITGTVTANLSATDNAVLDAIAADTTTIAGDTTSIDSKIPALGQALAAASVPVVLTAAQITTLTPPAAITGFATSAKQDTIIGHVDGIETSLTSIDGKITAVNTGAVVVSSSVLPSGAATAVKQPALGTAGTPSADVLTVQGTASMTALKVDGSAVTQPVSATDLDIRPLVNTDVVTAELSAVDNAVLDTIAAKDFATQTTLSAMNAKMVSGTDIGDVTINNASGASAVNIQDGGNTITVDGTVAVTQSGTWDEVGINDSGNSITVDYATTGSGTATGALRVELPTNGTGVIATVGAVTAITNALPAGTNAIGKLAANSGVDIGDVDVTSISAGTNLIGDVSLQPRTGNGCTLFRSIDLDETEEEIKATAGNLYGYYFANTTASARYIKLYNATAANTTVGTTTPIATFYLPPTSAGHVSLDFPVSFATALSAAATTGVADADTGAPGASDVLFMAWYK